MKSCFLACSFLILTYLLTGCNGNSGSNTGLSGDTLKAGEKPVYTENGKLQFIVEYKDGKANGRVRQYYPDGKINMDARYKDDHRNGKCIYYFKSGKPYLVSSYINGKKDSLETKYYENGQVSAIVPYKNDKVQPGLKEFAKDGTPKPVNNSLIISEVDHSALEGRFYIRVSLQNPRKGVKFYASPQSDPESRELLKMTGDIGILEVPVSSNSFVLKKLIFEGQYKTSMGNTMRLQRFYNLAIDR